MYAWTAKANDKSAVQRRLHQINNFCDKASSPNLAATGGVDESMMGGSVSPSRRQGGGNAAVAIHGMDLDL